MTKTTRNHELIIKVRFDKPCSKSHALASVRDCIHSDHYPYQPTDQHPGQFDVKTFKHLPRTAR